jgi:hypothetical protein
MKKYLLRIFIFLALGILLGEAVVRVFNLSVDVPKTYVDEDQLIKLYPNQSGTSVQRCKWIINEYGNFGPAPKSLDSLVTLIGNSYIVNTMNPPECHQAHYLTRESQDYNFYPMSRDGASFIEFMEMAKSLEPLNPVKQMLYVHDEDFPYSIIELLDQANSVQYSLEKKEIRYVQASESKLKKLLYKFKFAYFIYRNYFVLAELDLFNNNEEIAPVAPSLDYESLEVLFEYVKENYKIDNILLVFFPGSDPGLMDMTKNVGFECMLLDTDDYNSWLTSVNGHWSCYGHEQVARQVANHLSH